MSRRTRVAIATIAALLAVGSMAGYGLLRVRYWDSLGVTGLNYVPVVDARQPRVFGLEPGSVFMVYPGGPVAKGGMRAREALVSINGIPIADNAALQALDRRLRAGDPVTYRVRSDGNVRDMTVRLTSPLRMPLFLAACAVSVVVAMAFLAIGLFVFAKQPHDKRVMVFYAMVVVGAIYLIAAPALAWDATNIRGIHAGSSERNIVPLIGLMAAAVAFLPLTLHLALVFPRDRPVLRTSPRVFYWVWGVPLTLGIAMLFATTIGLVAATSKAALRRLDVPLNVFSAVLTLAGFVMALRIARRGRDEGVLRAFWNRPVQSLIFIVAFLMGLARVADAVNVKWLAFTAGILVGLSIAVAFTAFPVLACISMYRSYRDAGAEERRQVKWPLWGTAIALGTKITLAVIMQIGAFALMASHRDATTWLTVAQILDLLSTTLYLLIPISFAVAILKYRLMNIDVIIRKTVVYAILSGAIIVLYLVLVGGLGTLLVNVAGVRNQTMVIVSTLVVALLVVPVRNKLQTLVDRNLFRHKYDYPVALRAISADTLTSNDLAAFLASAAEKIQRALQNRAVVIFVTRHQDFVAAAKVGVADSFVGVRFARAPFTPFLDRSFDPRRHHIPVESATALRRMEAVLVVPINTPSTPANGFIALAAKLSDAPFDVEDIDFLESVADQLDLGIDRIRAQREEVDYAQAREIQQSLLPREMPRVHGLDVSGTWQPARTMGGDYYDLLELGDHELAVCIGDVAGKGMSAALTMSGLQAAVRASASDSPRDLCERVRRVVVSSLSGGRFITFFYATIDTAAMRLRWCNAGHNAPILARADGTVMHLSDGGPAFSRLFRGTPYEERETPFLAGDRIVLFTDGVSEATDRRGELFGEPRIEAIAASHRDLTSCELQATIVDAAMTFSEGELEDDVTLVVVQFAGQKAVLS